MEYNLYPHTPEMATKMRRMKTRLISIIELSEKELSEGLNWFEKNRLTRLQNQHDDDILSLKNSGVDLSLLSDEQILDWNV